MIAGEHFYGRVQADMDASHTAFTAHIGQDIPSGSTELIWRVRIDRKEGHAPVEDFLEERDNRYTCAKAG